MVVRKNQITPQLSIVKDHRAEKTESPVAVEPGDFASIVKQVPAPTLWRSRNFSRKYLPLYLMMIPAIAYLVVYRYVPMAGLVVSFQDFRLSRGVFRSPWVGFTNFTHFFTSPFFTMVLANTVVISLYKLIFQFPSPIILAIMLNEIRSYRWRRGFQTAVYLPHFISWVVVGYIVFTFFAPESGVFSVFLFEAFGTRINLIMNPRTFRGMLVVSDIWKTVGWGSIIYLATITTIDPQLYESATIDGAGKIQQIRFITVPGLMPAIVAMLLLRIGLILDAGFEQIFILQNPLVYNVSEILDTYIYKVAFLQGQHAIGAVAGFFKGVIGLVLVLITNGIARRFEQGVL